MRRLLYLDTARLGLPTGEVLRSLAAIGSFISREGLSSRFDDLLRGGFEDLPPAERRYYRGLCNWRGVAELRKSLAQLIGGSPGSVTLLASRTSQLMRLAAQLLGSRCRRVLVTDLEWPGFVRILEKELERRGSSIVSVPITELAFERGSDSRELSQLLAATYREQSCDGLFLSAVSHLGVRLPYSELLEELGDRPRPSFIVVDGSQALGHLPSPLGSTAPDFFIAGSHKWLAAYRPLGIASIGERVGDYSGEEIDDPLLAFLSGIEHGSAEQFSETVDLSGLFAAAAASAAAMRRCSTGERFSVLLDNADLVADASRGTGWDPLRPAAALRSGILLLRSSRGHDLPPTHVLRRCFRELGVVLTSYAGGVVRLSLPDEPLRHGDTDRIRKALRRVSMGGGRILTTGWDRRLPARASADTSSHSNPPRRGEEVEKSELHFVGKKDGGDGPIGACHDVEASVRAR
jgi:hypothetical protein